MNRTTYIVDFGNGIVEEIEADSLESAMNITDTRIGYTQESVSITSTDGNGEKYIRKWWGVPFDPNLYEDEEDKDIINYGQFGYYDEWEDCSEW